MKPRQPPSLSLPSALTSPSASQAEPALADVHARAGRPVKAAGAPQACGAPDLAGTSGRTGAEDGEAAVVHAMAALSHAQRLRAFRALVVAGPAGLTPGVMAAQLGMSPSALSFHLRELVGAGLAGSESRGRNLIYRADFDRMRGVLDYLTAHCCQGLPCAVMPTA